MMQKKLKIMAFIPARAGSKGITNKNGRLFLGEPLINRVVRQAQRSKFINRIIVSTESVKIAAIAKEIGAEIPCLRPTSLARDTSKVIDAVAHMLSFLKDKQNYVPDYLVLLQPTSPLRTTDIIDQAMTALLRSKAEAIVTVCQTEQLLFFKDKQGLLQLVSKKAFLSSTNRQELPSTYKLDGSMVYAIKTSALLAKRTFLPPRTLAHVIPRWRAVDLDEPEDFVLAELLAKNEQQIVKKIKNFF